VLHVFETPQQVPQQQNAFDCGVYTIMFAEMIFHNMMPFHEEDIKDRFSQYFAHHKITQQEVDEKRTKIRSLLDMYAALVNACPTTTLPLSLPSLTLLCDACVEQSEEGLGCRARVASSDSANPCPGRATTAAAAAAAAAAAVVEPEPRRRPNANAQ
jgi:hypothetical protein